MYLYSVILSIFLLLPAALAAQGGSDIAALITRVRLGEGAEVAKLLPQLEKVRPNDAGVIFLGAMLESNAEKSVELYQRIADEHPDSEWADDALYRLYQYSYAVGAYRTARTHMDKLSARYPRSPYAARPADATAAAKPAGANTDNGKKEAAPRPAEGYSVQVGAYTKADDASRQVAELKGKGYTAFVREKDAGGKRVHAVWLGLFTTFEQAQSFAAKLKQQQNIDAIVVRR